MTALRGAELIATALDQGREERDRAALALGAILCGYAIDSRRSRSITSSARRWSGSVAPPMPRRTRRSCRGRWPSWPPGRRPRSSRSPRRWRPSRGGIETRILELGGDPPGLGPAGADRSRLDEALDAILERPELAFTPDPPTRGELEELIERAW